MKNKADGQNKNIKNFNKPSNFMEKIGNKQKSIQALVIDIRLEVTHKNFLNDLKAHFNNQNVRKTQSSTNNHIIKKIRQIIKFKLKTNSNIKYIQNVIFLFY